jgi:hypothetical protein
MVTTTLNRFKALVRQGVAVAVGGLLLAPAAFAQATGSAPGVGAICTLVQYYKQLIGGIALIAGIVWFVGYVNKKDSLTDLAQTVIIGCVVVGALSYLISATGISVPTGC